MSRRKIIWVSISVGALYWIIEAMLFHEGNILDRIFPHGMHDTLLHLLVLCALIAFSIYAQFMINRRKLAEETLQKAHYELEMRVKERTAELTRINEQLQRDITERGQAEEKIQIYQEQFRSLIFKLALLEERERKRISEELHDNISQNLAFSKIKIAALRESKSSADIARELDEIRELIDQAIQFTRSLTLELSPRILYDLGFEAAIEWLAKQIQKKHGIMVDFASDGKLKQLNGEMSVLLFRIVRELLINSVKHAKAHNARVTIRSDDDNIRINVEDNGIGFDISKIWHYSGKTESFGLVSIRERINYIGGTIEIISQPGQGTMVTLICPIEPNTNEETVI